MLEVEIDRLLKNREFSRCPPKSKSIIGFFDCRYDSYQQSKSSKIEIAMFVYLCYLPASPPKYLIRPFYRQDNTNTAVSGARVREYTHTRPTHAHSTTVSSTVASRSQKRADGRRATHKSASGHHTATTHRNCAQHFLADLCGYTWWF